MDLFNSPNWSEVMYDDLENIYNYSFIGNPTPRTLTTPINNDQYIRFLTNITSVVWQVALVTKPTPKKALLIKLIWDTIGFFIV